MRLFEYEGLRLLAEAGIPTPRFALVRSADEAEKTASEIGLPVVLKAQVLVGGRGKAGGVRFAGTLEEVRAYASALLGSRIKGETVGEILVAEGIKHAEELYLAFVVDRSSNSHLLLASRAGGVDVEELVRNRPESLLKTTIDPLVGLRDWHVRKAASFMDLPAPASAQFQYIVKALYNIYRKYYCDLAEINPLALSEDNRLVALDAKVILDDNAARMYGFSFSRLQGSESEAERLNLNYVELDGDIGVVCNGAGLTMATMDLVYTLGGRPACFLDLGGGASAERVYTALKFIFDRPRVNAIFLNILGGITRCDEVAEGIVKAVDELGFPKPLIVRLVGTREDEGRRILESRKIGFYTRMYDAAKAAIDAASTVACY